MIDSQQDFENSLGVSFSDNHIPDDDSRPSGGCLIRLILPLALIIGIITAVASSCNSPADSDDALSPNTNTIATTQPSSFESRPSLIPELPSIDFSQFETTPSLETQPATTAPVTPSKKETPLKFISYPKTVSRNEEVSVTIQGKPYTKYSITVEYSSGPSTADGLETKYSNKNGYVEWTWHVGGKTNPGTFTITVSGGGEIKTVSFSVID